LGFMKLVKPDPATSRPLQSVRVAIHTQIPAPATAPPALPPSPESPARLRAPLPSPRPVSAPRSRVPRPVHLWAGVVAPSPRSSGVVGHSPRLSARLVDSPVLVQDRFIRFAYNT
jgi:hypothetical protein